MGSVTPYDTTTGRRYRVRYRLPDNSQTDKRGFKTKREAELFLANVDVAKSRGEFVSAAMTLDVYADLFDDDLDAVGDALSAAVDPAAWEVTQVGDRSDYGDPAVVVVRECRWAHSGWRPRQWATSGPALVEAIPSHSGGSPTKRSIGS